MKPVAEFWFGIEPEAEAVLRIREINIEHYGVGDIWLVRGSNKDVAVDTGSGIVSPVPLLESIAEKPVLAVALVSYYDHAGGWHFFRERACHIDELSALQNPDNTHIGDFLTEERLWALPRPEYSLEEYRHVGAEPTEVLRDGDIIDLGNRQLEVIHAPGRTAGSIALWEAATGSLFTGDVLYDGPLYPAWPPKNVEAHCATLKKLADLPVRRVFAGHYGAFGRDRMLQLIDEHLEDLTTRV